jgi:restriction system protein
MSRRRQPGKSSRKRRSEPFLEKGLLMLFMAGGFWLASVMLTGSPILAAVGTSLRSILWVPLAIGFGLLGVHFILKKVLAAKQPQLVPRPAASPPDVWKEPSLERPYDPSASVRRSDPVSQREQRVKADQWGSDVFAAIEWRRFEAVVEALFAQAGFETRSQSHGADGGVDIWLHSKNAEGPVSVVQCKHWQGKPVTVKEMREFLGVMVSKGLKRGTYATTSRYTTDALEFAKANGINAQDGAGLLKLIAQRTPEQQARLLDVAYEGEYWKPTCASCGVKMTERTPKYGGAAFWGCVNFPRCKRTLAMKVGRASFS